ncbi:MAG: transposase [Actinomycetota bacterium]|nr:transposase [Actinomycetota bacterium]
MGRQAVGRSRFRDLRRRPRSRPGSAATPRWGRHHGATLAWSTNTNRGGALAYLAAWDVHRAKVMGRCEPTTGIAPFERLVTQVMTTEPYASARRVFWVVDNGSSHRGQRAADRLRAQWPNARLVQLPVHASWLNQVEIYFSVVQRKVLTPNDFADLAEVESRLADFERRYEENARPFEWKFTRGDLAKLIDRLADKPDYERAA